MATTYEAIATVEVGSGGAASISFTSIPADWTDLVVKLCLRGTASGDLRVYFNFNSAGLNATSKLLYGFGDGTVGSTGYSTGVAAFGMGASNLTADTFGNLEVYIPNYAGSAYKSLSSDGVGESNDTSSGMGLMAVLWSNTAAITSIAITPPSGTFVQYSTATLYGIKNS